MCHPLSAATDVNRQLVANAAPSNTSLVPPLKQCGSALAHNCCSDVRFSMCASVACGLNLLMQCGAQHQNRGSCLYQCWGKWQPPRLVYTQIFPTATHSAAAQYTGHKEERRIGNLRLPCCSMFNRCVTHSSDPHPESNDQSSTIYLALQSDRGQNLPVKQKLKFPSTDERICSKSNNNRQRTQRALSRQDMI